MSPPVARSPVVSMSDPGYVAADAAYTALRAGDDATALAQFEQAASFGPVKPSVALDAAYTARRLQRPHDAARWFHLALATDDATAPLSQEQVTNTRVELAPLEQRWGGSALLSYSPVGLAAGGLPSATGSQRRVTQAGAEIYARPRLIQPDTGGGVELFARYFQTLRDAPGAATGGETGQGAAGVRWRPWLTTNLVLEAGRLVKVGSASRNDTQLRVAYSLDHGTGYQRGAASGESWPGWRLYAEADRFTETGQTIALAEAQYGRNWAVGPADSRMTVFPHVLLAGSYDNSLATPSAYSTGVGVTQRIPLGPAWGLAAVDLTLQYRVRLGGDADRARGLFFTVSGRF